MFVSRVGSAGNFNLADFIIDDELTTGCQFEKRDQSKAKWSDG